MSPKIEITSAGSPPSANEVLCCCGVVENGSPYTFSVKPIWRTVVFHVFVAPFSAEAYLHTMPPRGYSMVGVPNHGEGCVVMWLRAREEFADNRFQLLLIYV